MCRVRWEQLSRLLSNGDEAELLRYYSHHIIDFSLDFMSFFPNKTRPQMAAANELESRFFLPNSCLVWLMDAVNERNLKPSTLLDKIYDNIAGQKVSF